MKKNADMIFTEIFQRQQTFRATILLLPIAPKPPERDAFIPMSTGQPDGRICSIENQKCSNEVDELRVREDVQFRS